MWRWRSATSCSNVSCNAFGVACECSNAVESREGWLIKQIREVSKEESEQALTVACDRATSSTFGFAPRYCGVQRGLRDCLPIMYATCGHSRSSAVSTYVLPRGLHAETFNVAPGKGGTRTKVYRSPVCGAWQWREALQITHVATKEDPRHEYLRYSRIVDMFVMKEFHHNVAQAVAHLDETFLSTTSTNARKLMFIDIGWQIPPLQDIHWSEAS